MAFDRLTIPMIDGPAVRVLTMNVLGPANPDWQRRRQLLIDTLQRLNPGGHTESSRRSTSGAPLGRQICRGARRSLSTSTPPSAERLSPTTNRAGSSVTSMSANSRLSPRPGRWSAVPLALRTPSYWATSMRRPMRPACGSGGAANPSTASASAIRTRRQGVRGQGIERRAATGDHSSSSRLTSSSSRPFWWSTTVWVSRRSVSAAGSPCHARPLARIESPVPA